jgi:hypothetical protein
VTQVTGIIKLSKLGSYKPGIAPRLQNAPKLRAGRLRGILNAVRPGQNRGPRPATQVYGVLVRHGH